MQQLDAISASISETATRTDAMRVAVEGAAASIAAMTKAVESSAALEVELANAKSGLPIEAIVAADEATWLNMFMPDGEARRRLIAGIVAARPFLEAEARKDERNWTLRDVVARLEGMTDDDRIVEHFKSLIR